MRLFASRIESLKSKILSISIPWKLKELSVKKVLEDVFHIINPRSIIDKSIFLFWKLKFNPISNAIQLPLFVNKEKFDVSVIKALIL